MIKILNFDELRQKYLKNKNSIKAIHYGDHTIENDGRYINFKFERYYCYFVDGVIVHITKVWFNKPNMKLNNKPTVSLCYSSTNFKFANQKIASKVLKDLVQDCKKAKLPLYMSYYTEEGFATIAKVVDRLCDLYKIELWDGTTQSEKIYKPYHVVKQQGIL